VTDKLGVLCSRTRAGVKVAFLPIFLAFIGLLLPCVALHGQVQTGISGTVADSSGAVIPGAKVTITNTSTGVVSATTTTSIGTFTVVGLQPGTYSVAADSSGFMNSVGQVMVEVARISTINISLQPGSTSQTVNVKETAITLDTTSPVVGTTLEPELVKDAPIEISGLARQIDSFSYLAPGVQGSATYHNINGGDTFENEVQFNGVPVAFVQYQGNQSNLNPPYEAVNEFRVSGSTFDAQYGPGQGAVTFNMASGTNDLHGDAFEIIRNQLFDSDGFFPVRFSPSGKPEPPVNQENNYGFTVGGPVILPHLYKGRNRTFFHFSADWFRQNQAQNSIGTVPTAAEKSGDFSHFMGVDSAGNQIVVPIYDPTTGMPFPNNKIPSNRISALATSLLSDIPNPDPGVGVNNGQVSNKLPTIPSVPIRQTLWAYTLDETLTTSQSIHFSQWRDVLNSPTFSFAPIVPISNPLQSEATNQNLGSGFLLNYVKTINPNLVLTAGADWIGNNISQFNGNTQVNFAGVQGGDTLPLITFDGQSASTGWGVAGGEFLECCEGGLTLTNNRLLGIVGVTNMLWTKGRHTTNFGFQVRHDFQDIVDCVFCSGTFNFTQRTTSTPDSSDQNFGYYGSSFASFLLGEVDATERIFAGEDKLRNKAFAGYAQDSFKVSKRLTVSAGIRWDVFVPFTENHNNIVYLDRTEPNPGAGGLLGAATKFGDCPGCSGITRAAIHWKNFQPRLGVSYQISPKTVLQAGGYITYLNGGAYEFGTAFTASFMSSQLQGSFLRSSTGSSTPGYGSWDAQTLPAPAPTPFSPTVANGGEIFDFPAVHRNAATDLDNTTTVGTSPYDQAWNAGVQRELPWGTFVTVSYVGNRAIHLPTTLELSNQPNPSVLQYGSLLGDNILDPAVVAAGFKPPYPGYVAQYGAAATLEQALTPYPQLGAYFPAYEMDGTSFYNALQAQGEKRFSNGVSYLADITLARNTANTAVASTPDTFNGMNAYNPRPEYARSPLDQVYNFKLVGTYALPFGHGKRYLNSTNTFISELVAGWQISGILEYEGGNPFGAQNSFNPVLVNGFDRPNIVPSVHLKTFSYSRSKAFFTGKTPTQPVQFPTNAFQNTGPWALGTAVRSYPALRTPPLRLESFNAIKSFRIGDHVQASLRIDYFNAFNRTQLQSPDNNSLDSTFGQITNLSSQISNRQGQATFRVEF
jgi:hypothetical protein